MTSPYVVLTKTLGQTPLQALDAWRGVHPTYQETPATYAGRLDPMATGKLLVLLGEECKKQEAYRGLDKEYEIELLLDFSTDTGDVLGMPTYSGLETFPYKSAVDAALKKELGTHQVPYPAFSSKTVQGKPLFLYALEGTLATISLPTHQETIHRITYQGSRTILASKLSERIEEMLSHAPRSNEPSKTLGADFRQDEISAAWQASLSPIQDRAFLVLTLRVVCGSGAYMRTLAERIGKSLGTRALALSINRTKIGTYRTLLGIRFWTKEYR